MKNPVAFNPLTMTANQLVQCADALRTMFDLLDRDGTAEDVKHAVMQTREHMRKTWNAQ